MIGRNGREGRSLPTPTSREATLQGTSVRFRSGRVAFVTSPESAELRQRWTEALERGGMVRLVRVTVALTSRPGWPEQAEIVDLGSVESMGVKP